MTGVELQEAFGIQVNQFDSLLRPDSDDIFYWLTQAQTKMVKEGFERFEKSPEEAEFVRPFIKTCTVTTKIEGTIGYPEIEIYRGDLPPNFLAYLTSRSKILYSRTGIALRETEPDEDGLRSVEVEPDTPQQLRTVPNHRAMGDTLHRLIEDPFHRPKGRRGLVSLSDRKIRGYGHSTFAISGILLEYVRVPHDVTRTEGSELPDHTHYQLVELGVSLFLNNTRNLKQNLQRETPTG